MVETQFIQTVLKQLEKYLIERNDFHLNGDTYDLILLVPSDKYEVDTKYSLIISCKRFDSYNRKTAISDLLNYLKESLSYNFYNALSRVNFIHSDDPFVKSMKMVFGFREPLFEIKDYPVAGIRIEFAYLIKSLILDKLIENSAVTIEFEKDGIRQLTNAGIVRIDRNFELVYYTGKGLNEIWKPELKGDEALHAEFLKTQTEEYLLENQYIDKINFNSLIRVI